MEQCPNVQCLVLSNASRKSCGRFRSFEFMSRVILGISVGRIAFCRPARFGAKSQPLGYLILAISNQRIFLIRRWAFRWQRLLNK